MRDWWGDWERLAGETGEAGETGGVHSNHAGYARFGCQLYIVVYTSHQVVEIVLLRSKLSRLLDN